MTSESCLLLVFLKTPASTPTSWQESLASIGPSNINHKRLPTRALHRRRFARKGFSGQRLQANEQLFGPMQSHQEHAASPI